MAKAALIFIGIVVVSFIGTMVGSFYLPVLPDWMMSFPVEDTPNYDINL